MHTRDEVLGPSRAFRGASGALSVGRIAVLTGPGFLFFVPLDPKAVPAAGDYFALLMSNSVFHGLGNAVFDLFADLFKTGAFHD